MKNSHLLLCQCCPFVTPGFVMLTEICPQEAVFKSSVKLPRSSTFIFIGNAIFSGGR